MQQDPGVDQDGTVIPRTSLARRLVRIAMAVLGAIGGGVLGLAIMLAIVVGKARAGVYTFSLHDLVAIRWETLPVVLGLPGGAYLGYMHAHTLDHAARRGFALLALGIVAWRRNREHHHVPPHVQPVGGHR